MTGAVADLKIEHDDLIGMARQGDSLAFYQLYQAYSGYAYAILRRHLGSSSHIEDLLQQVFLKIYRELPEFRGDKPFRAWLRRACSFVVYDHLRQSKRRMEVHGDRDLSSDDFPETVDYSVSETACPENAYLGSEIHKHALRVLDKLKPEKRMALVLHDFEGHTLQEAAEILGVSSFTVRTRLVRARREYAKLAARDSRLMQLIGRRVK